MRAALVIVAALLTASVLTARSAASGPAERSEARLPTRR